MHPYDFALPIFQAEDSGNGFFDYIGEVRGSAFRLAGNYFLTAGHVIESIPRTATDLAVIGLFDPRLQGFKGVSVDEAESLGSDIALLRVASDEPDLVAAIRCFRWDQRPLPTFSDVRSAGYAYGIHRGGDHQSLVIRGFKGHVVSTLLEFRPVGAKIDPFRVYELSFAAPRGLSGAPLYSASGPVAIHGLVIGNSETQTVVFRSVERAAEDGAMNTVEHYEALCVGIAVPAEIIMAKYSQLLGQTLREYIDNIKVLSS
jgi:hypothetical protein